MQEVNKLVERASALLADGTVDRVLGWKAGEFGYDVTPAVFRSAQELEQSFVWNDFCGANFSKYLVKETLGEGKVLVCLKPCDTYRFNQLLTEHRFNREKVYAIGVPCDGMLDGGKLRDRAGELASFAVEGDTVTVETLYDGTLTLPRAELLPDRPDALDYVYDAGVRLITLTWNYLSRYGCSSAVDQNEGLTELGKQLVRDCGEKGIIVDVSHLSDRGFRDVCEATDRPFVATHSDSRVLCRNSRNLTDEQFAESANRRGLVGVNLYTPVLVRQSDSVIDDAIDHIERFIGMYGEKVVALGCDFDGCDTLPIGIDGLADMYRLADRMLTLGYKQETFDGLFYDNAFNFMQKML